MTLQKSGLGTIQNLRIGYFSVHKFNLIGDTLQKALIGIYHLNYNFVKFNRLSGKFNVIPPWSLKLKLCSVIFVLFI